MRTAILFLALLAALVALCDSSHKVRRLPFGQYGRYVNNINFSQRQRILRIHEGRRRHAHNGFEAKPCKASPGLKWSKLYAELAAIFVKPIKKGNVCNSRSDNNQLSGYMWRFLRLNGDYIDSIPRGFYTTVKRPASNVGFTKPDAAPSDVIRAWARQSRHYRAFRKAGSSHVTETCQGKDLKKNFFNYILKFTRIDYCGEYRNMITERAHHIGCASTVCATNNPAGNGTHALNVICWYDDSINFAKRHPFKSCTGNPPARPKAYYPRLVRQ